MSCGDEAMASSISLRFAFFQQVHSAVTADDSTDTLLHELRNIV